MSLPPPPSSYSRNLYLYVIIFKTCILHSSSDIYIKKWALLKKKCKKKEKDLSAHPTTTMEQHQIHQLEPRKKVMAASYFIFIYYYYYSKLLLKNNVDGRGEGGEVSTSLLHCYQHTKIVIIINIIFIKLSSTTTTCYRKSKQILLSSFFSSDNNIYARRSLLFIM